MDDEERQAWVAELKRKYGVRCIGDEKDQAVTPAWQDYVPAPSTDGVPYRFFSLGPLLASPDGVHWYEKPEDMTTEEFFASLPLGSC